MEKYKGILVNFLVTSAINQDTRRLQELLKTFESVWMRYPLSTIHLSETSRIRPSDAFLSHIPTRVEVVGFWGAEWIDRAHDTNLPIGFIQNAIEMQSIQRMMDLPFWNDRTYKLSGRYQLTDDFSPDDHDLERFTFRHPLRTGFSMDQVGTEGMLMTRLFGFPTNQAQYLKSVLERIESEHWQRWLSGKVFDIEHGLFKHLDHQKCQFLDKIGVRGRIGHLEHIVED